VKSRFDVAESAGANNNYVYIMMLSARDDGACHGAFLHFTHDIVNALVPRPFLRIRNHVAGDLFQNF